MSVIYTIVFLLYSFSNSPKACERLIAFESWEGLRRSAMLPDGGGAKLELRASDAQVLPVPAFPHLPYRPTGPGLLWHRQLSPSQGRSVTTRSLSGSRGSHVAFSRATSRGQHPPRKGSFGCCLPRAGTPRLSMFLPAPLVLCCCVKVLATEPFASLLLLTVAFLSQTLFVSNSEKAENRPMVWQPVGRPKEAWEGRGFRIP